MNIIINGAGASAPVVSSRTKVPPPKKIIINGAGASVLLNRKHLFHIDEPNHYQFITFRTQDSIDPYLKKIAQLELATNKKQFLIDQYLDLSKVGAYLNGEVLLLLSDYIKSHDKNIYDLIAFCIMPNHIHILIKPLYELNKVMQIIKGGSAKLINKSMLTNGRFWAPGYYDKLIRNENHLLLVYQYIKNNPLVLCESDKLPSRFFSIYE